MAERERLYVELVADVSSYVRGLTTARSITAGADTQTRALNKQLVEQERRAKSAGKGMVTAGALISGGLLLSARAAAKWESASASFEKTIDTNAAGYKRIGTELTALSTRIPVAANELAELAGVAGQLGVQADQVVQFTEVVAALGVTTDLSAMEAASSLAQFQNAMGESTDTIDEVGSVVVALGNNMATTESQIVAMAQRLAGAGAVAGLTQGEVLALAASMSEVGVRAELGGSAMSRTLAQIDKAVGESGEQLAAFAQVSGMSADGFARAWQEDPAAVLQSLMSGLGNLVDSGGDVYGTFDSLGIKGSEMQGVLLRLASNSDGLRDALGLQSEAWNANVALMEEAEKRYATAESRLVMAKNQAVALAVELGGMVLPALVAFAEGGADVLKFVADLPTPIQAAVVILGGLAAVVSLAGGAFLLAAPKIALARTELQRLAVASPAAATAMGGMGAAARTAGGILAGPWGVALTAGTLALGAFTMKKAAATDVVRQYTDAIISDSGAMEENTRELARQRLEAEGALAAAERMGLNLRDVTDAATGNADAQEKVNGALARYVENSGGAEGLERRADVESLTSALGFEQEATAKASEEARRKAEVDTDGAAATAVLEDATRQMEDASYGVARAMGMSSEEADAYAETIKDMQSVVQGFIDPLGAYEDALESNREEKRAWYEAHASEDDKAQTSVEEFVAGAKVSLAEWAAELEERNKNHAEWGQNLVTVSDRFGADVAETLFQMGADGVQAVALMAHGGDEEGQRLAAALRHNAAIGGEGMNAELRAAMLIGERVMGEGGRRSASALAHELGLKVGEVRRIAEKYGVELAAGVNPLLVAMGKPSLRVSGVNGRVGGVLLAEGGLMLPPGLQPDDRYSGSAAHVAQIAGPNEWRVWAETEKGGEAYIPLDPSKRDQSRAILQQTAGILGGVALFREGGFWSPSQVPPVPSFDPVRQLADPARGTSGRARDAVVERVQGMMERQQVTGGSSVGLTGATAAMRQALLATFGPTTIHGFARRNIAGTRTVSKHALGLALDFMTTNRARGDAVVEFAERYPGVNNIIWQQRIKKPGGAWRGMSDRGSLTQNHRDHVHIDRFFAEGGLWTPGGILNPWVRDKGGLLRPGYTVNKTSGPEVVMPPSAVRAFASGGIDAQVTAQGGQALLDRLAAIFHNRGVEIASDDELAGDRLRRMAAEIRSGQATLDDKRRSVDRLAVQASGEVPKPGPVGHNVGVLATSVDGLQQQLQRYQEAAETLEQTQRRQVLVAERDLAVRQEQAAARARDRGDVSVEAWKKVADRVTDAHRELRAFDVAAHNKGQEALLRDALKRAEERASAEAKRRSDLEQEAQRLAQVDLYATGQRVGVTTTDEQRVRELLGSAMDAYAAKTPPSAEGLLARLNAENQRMGEWMTGLTFLRGRGLSEDAMQHLGLKDGAGSLDRVQALLASSSESLRALSKAFDRRETIAAGASVVLSPTISVHVDARSDARQVRTMVARTVGEQLNGVVTLIRQGV